jgi:hypothetical protein
MDKYVADIIEYLWRSNQRALASALARIGAFWPPLGAQRTILLIFAIVVFLFAWWPWNVLLISWPLCAAKVREAARDAARLDGNRRAE